MRARWLAVAGIVAVVATAGFVLGRETAPSPLTNVAVPLLTTATDGGSDDQATRFVSYYGLTMTVPATWPVIFGACPELPGDGVVAYQSGPTSCTPSGFPADAPPPPAHPLVVTLLPWVDDAGVGTPVVAAGRPAVRMVGADSEHPGSATVTVEFHDPMFTVSVSAPDEAAADAILATARRTPVDPFGCADQLPSTLTNPRAAALLPAVPVAGVVCDYDSPYAQRSGEWLAGSRRMSPSQLADLAAHVRAAPPYRPAPPAHPTGNGPYPKRYLLRFADGSTRTLDIRNDGSGAGLGNGDPVVGSDGTHRVLLDTNGSWQPPGAFDV